MTYIASEHKTLHKAIAKPSSTLDSVPYSGVPGPDRLAAQGTQEPRGVCVCGRASFGAGRGGGAARNRR